jgi:signal transduction histidine kinase
MGQTKPPNVHQTWSEAEAALLKSQTQATAGQFAVAVMHEINSPLEAISNLVFLVEHYAEDPFEVRKYIQMAEEQLVQVRRIAHQTLKFYRQGDVQEPVDFVGLAEAALRIHDHKITAKRLRLHKDLQREAMARAHAGDMLQVVSNLIANALDALPEEGTLYLRVRKSRDEVHVTIADNGHGIPQEAVDKIFEPFFTTKKEHGTGLGLAISRSIVERHKGRIRLRSSVRGNSSGTVFRISLPVHRSSDSLKTTAA